MPKVFKLILTAEQEEELETARDHHEKPYVREKAAGILKVSEGQSIRQVARHGLLKPRRPQTVKDWINRFLEGGVRGLLVRKGRGRKTAFVSLSQAEAKEAVDFVLHQSPRQYGLKRTGWRLQDVGRALRWLEGYSDAGIYKVLKRLGFSRKKALDFIRSPDPNYRYKWQRVLTAYQEAVTNPEQVILLFQDELTYYRRAKIGKTLQRRGQKQQRHHRTAGANTKARITAVLNALTGQVIYRQRSKVGVKVLIDFYAQIRPAYPNVQWIYLVEDNWPVHYHPAVVEAAENNNLTLLFLPTYASWLNPIEKLWRWLRQDILHNHNHSATFKHLRHEVVEFLDQFTQRSLKLLYYVGLLSKNELTSMCRLNC